MFSLLKKPQRSQVKSASMAFSRPCFSLEGEDILLQKCFPGKTGPGFYVDVGAHHPQKFSNTYALYLKGWRGINIDAMPGSMALFNELRPEDINVEQSISLSPKELIFYVFDEPALNSFSKELSERRAATSPYKIVEQIQLQTARLDETLERHLPPGQSIDLMTVDAEGFDLEVLQSNDWERYAPEILLVEDIEWLVLDRPSDSSIYNYMITIGYQPICKLWRSVFYRKRAQD